MICLCCRAAQSDKPLLCQATYLLCRCKVTKRLPCVKGAAPKGLRDWKLHFCISAYGVVQAAPNPSVTACAVPPPFTQGRLCCFSCLLCMDAAGGRSQIAPTGASICKALKKRRRTTPSVSASADSSLEREPFGRFSGYSVSSKHLEYKLSLPLEGGGSRLRLPEGGPAAPPPTHTKTP